jgi:hypothetical protein
LTPRQGRPLHARRRGYPDRSRTLRLRHRSRVAHERGTKRFRARLSNWGQRRSAILRACVRSSTPVAPRGLGRTAHRHRRFEHIRTPLEWLRCGESHSGVGPKRRVHGSCGISGVRTRPHSCERTAAPGLKRRREGPGGEPNAKLGSFPSSRPEAQPTDARAARQLAERVTLGHASTRHTTDSSPLQDLCKESTKRIEDPRRAEQMR